DLKFTTDFRRVYATMLDQWLNADSTVVLKNKFEPLAFFSGADTSTEKSATTHPADKSDDSDKSSEPEPQMNQMMNKLQSTQSLCVTFKPSIRVFSGGIELVRSASKPTGQFFSKVSRIPDR